jgi:hypothetical protein
MMVCQVRLNRSCVYFWHFLSLSLSLSSLSRSLALYLSRSLSFDSTHELTYVGERERERERESGGFKCEKSLRNVRMCLDSTQDIVIEKG